MTAHLSQESPLSSRELVHEALDLSQLLLTLADKEPAPGDENDCLVLDGVLRDCAYKIRRAAEDLQAQVERN